MGQINKEFAELMLERAERGDHSGLTVWEEKQLALAWLALHGHKTWPGMPCKCHPDRKDERIEQLERELALANGRIDYLLSDSSHPEDRAIALLRELNDALAVPGYLQARVDEILDSCEPQLPKA